MGLFCLNTEDTIDGYLDACVRNIQMYREDNELDYLISGFASSQLEEAMKLMYESKEEQC